MIQMFVLHDTPARAGNGSKDPARRPRRGWPSRPEALNELAQSTYVGSPRGGTSREEFGRALPLSFRPRQDMNREPIQWKARQRSGWWTSLELTESLPQIAAYMTNHFRRRESTPDRRALGGQSGDPIHNGGPNLWIKN